MFLMWLGEQITSRGIGNGISLIIMAGHSSRSFRVTLATCSRRTDGSISPLLILGIIMSSA
jgi:preprotein translocase subunit SecY